MISQNQVKFLHALQVKKYRQKYRKFIVEGEKMVAELLHQKTFGIHALFGLERWANENAALLSAFSPCFNPVSEAELKKISTLVTPNAVLAVADMPDANPELHLPDSKPCFYLDGLQDPGNLGAILRISDWFGFPAVFCSTDTVDVYSPKVVQASMGAIFRVKTMEISLLDLIQHCPAATVAGAFMDGESIFGQTLPAKGLIVIGNEGKGIRPETAALLTRRISIPRHEEGGAESLNAAIAAGILAAWVRQPT
jgi:RNA methyltransferase, TrmH family